MREDVKIVYEALTLEEGTLTVSSDGLEFVAEGRDLVWSVPGLDVRDWRIDDGTLQVTVADEGRTMDIDLWTGSEGARPEFVPSRDASILALARSKATWRRRPIPAPGIGENLPFLRKGGRAPSWFEGPGGQGLAISNEMGGACPDVFTWNGGHYATVDGMLVRFAEDLSTVWERSIGVWIQEVLPVGDKLLAFGNDEVVSITPDNRVEWTIFVDDPSLVRADGDGLMVVTDWRRIDHVFDPVTGSQVPPEPDDLRRVGARLP